jgi:glycosyltransferase involved in cell wall biosynthesis
MSDAETTHLRELIPELPAAFAIGNGADVETFAMIERTPVAPNVFFTGTMSFPPNAVAAQWLAREVWPSVLEAQPNAQLLIVGRGPSAATRALGELPGVQMVADAPEILPWFERAAVFALPMLEGGGTRLKLAEAMAAGRPIVSTTNGATGVDVSDGVELLIADSPTEFAAAILHLLNDPELRKRMGEAGRAKACAKYDWQKLGDEFAAVLEWTVEQGRR